MNHCLEMVLSFLCLLFVLLEHGLGLNDCTELGCGGGPAIRFPFRLKDRQPYYCGYPGFDLSCTQRNETTLQLPTSVKLYINYIDYKSQVIHAYDPDGCFARHVLNLSLSTSPFQFEGKYKWDYTLFNCSSTELYGRIPCLSVPGYNIYAIDSDYDVSHLSLSSCTKMYNISSIPSYMFFDDILYLNWSKPTCGFCEEKGKGCRLKNSSTEYETECFDKPKPIKDASREWLTIGIVLGSFLLVIVVIALYRIYRSHKLEGENQAKIKKFLEDYRALKPTRYSYADLKRITNQFRDKLGQGAYGTVFKGKLSNEILVAVKILNSSMGNGEEFVNEVGTMGRIHHVNVVRLVGYCADGFRKALVYEFLPNESLEKFIFSSDGKNHFLGWEKLQDIALGIAKGIEYLHQGCDQQILHFDIKPHNILLDEKFNPKISDFGLAKLCSKDQSAVSMTVARGTMGYIAPEVFSRNFGNVSYKSDVYSFGMLLLEMVGGRKNVDVNVENTSQVYFPEWIYNRLDRGEELIIQIEEEGDAKIARKLTIVGLWCIQWYPLDRPSMKIVVQMLEGGGENLTMPPNPFASTGATRRNASMPGRRLHQELAVISET